MTENAASRPIPTFVQMSALVTMPSDATVNLSSFDEEKSIPFRRIEGRVKILLIRIPKINDHINGLTGL